GRLRRVVPPLCRAGRPCRGLGRRLPRVGSPHRRGRPPPRGPCPIFGQALPARTAAVTAARSRTTLRALAVALLLTPLARAQVEPQRNPARGDLPLPGEGFEWERVGDRPIEADDLAFTDDGALWAASADGPYHLDLTEGFPGRWVLIDEPSLHGAILPLGPDTLVGNTGA